MHPGQGSDRPRLRRAHVLGHRGLRAARCSPTRCPDAAADALRWRHSTLDLARARAEAARPRGRGLPVADDPRPGVLRLLAGRHGGLPRQRRHRRRGRALLHRDRRRRLRGRGRARAAGRDRPAVDVARPPRPRRPLAHRRRDRPGRVQRRRRRQRLHQPDGGAQPARGGRGRGPPSRPRHASSASTDEEAGRGGPPRPPSMCPYDEELGVHPQSEGFTRHAGVGLRGVPRQVPAAAAPRPTTSSTASRSSSRPTWCWRCTGAATRSHRRRRRATSTTTSGARSATRRCRRARRR